MSPTRHQLLSELKKYPTHKVIAAAAQIAPNTAKRTCAFRGDPSSPERIAACCILGGLLAGTVDGRPFDETMERVMERTTSQGFDPAIGLPIFNEWLHRMTKYFDEEFPA